MPTANKKTFFAPQLHIPSGLRNVDFYTTGLGATELRRFNNDDGTLHVAELSIDGALFHVHEEKLQSEKLEPVKNGGVTALIGLFVDDVDATVTKAVAAGAQLLNPPQDYDYGYRQAEIKDPFGHIWLIQKRID